VELDLADVRQKCLEVRNLLLDEGYRVQIVLLFGSQAKKTAHENSDIDLAFVSIDFGQDSFKESSLINRLLFKKISGAEGVAVPLKDFMDPFPLSPIAWEIKKTGIPLF
jgi:predicted nucleotidyltransferase